MVTSPSLRRTLGTKVAGGDRNNHPVMKDDLKLPDPASVGMGRWTVTL
jgi:hypothetical protein